ncbi:hypothetical protein D9M71_781940 [compost metagenome]
MAKATTESVELPNHQGIAFTQGLQARGQSGPIIFPSRSHVLIQMCSRHSSSDQSILLQISRLGAIRLRYPHVADQHTLSIVTNTFDYVTA